MQTAFPAKVIRWDVGTNTVELEPQFIETWVTQDGSREQEPRDQPYISNVPVLYPRSGGWSITFPIVPGSFGLVLCTKYSLDVWRGQGNATDPGDLRRFTMSGAVFFPVNLYPDDETLSEINTPNSIDPIHMVLGQGGALVDFVALAGKVNGLWETFINATPGTADGGAALQTAVRGYWETSLASQGTGSTKVKVQ
jgi:Phage protein Gp138 N-terminal domain